MRSTNKIAAPSLEISQVSNDSREFDEYYKIIKKTFKTSLFVKILSKLRSDNSKTYILKKDKEVIAGFFTTDVTIPLLKPVYFLRLSETRKKINNLMSEGILKDSEYLCYFAAKDRASLKIIRNNATYFKEELKELDIHGHTCAGTESFNIFYETLGAKHLTDNNGEIIKTSIDKPWLYF
jgi:hypothetical protein